MTQKSKEMSKWFDRIEKAFKIQKSKREVTVDESKQPDGQIGYFW